MVFSKSNIWSKNVKSLALSGLFFLLTFTQWVQANESSALVHEIRANYQLKASFFSLPITVKIGVKKINQEIYQASINLNSPFLKVEQKETARIKQCSIELLEIKSKGSRVGAQDWDESVSVSWPQKLVSYQDGKNNNHEYLALSEPTGFASLFAHQFVFLRSLSEQSQSKTFEHESSMQESSQSNSMSKTLIYTQSVSGWPVIFEVKERAETTKNKFFGHPVPADKIEISLAGNEEEDLPTVWYYPEKLGAFPLKMAMRLGVLKIDTNLKTINANSNQILQFFDEWGCGR